jgi:hypothetical protein
MSAIDVLTPTPMSLRSGLAHLREDLALVAEGILDPRSLVDGFRKMVNPVEVRTTSLIADDARVSKRRLVADPSLFTDPVQDEHGVWRDRAFGMQRRAFREIRRTHNLRVTMGRDQWQRVLMSGDVGTGSLNGLASTATASSATTLTDTGATFPTATSSAGNAGLQGHIVVVGPNASGTGSQVFGVIVSNTGTVLTVDQWYALPCTGAAGTTPNATGKYFVMPGAGWAAWIGLSTASAAPAAADILRTADGLFGDGTGAGAATEQTASGLGRTYVAATFPSASNIQYQNTWTYTGSSLVTIPKVVMCNSKAVAGSLLFLETLLNNSGTVSANGDTLQVTWTVTL